MSKFPPRVWLPESAITAFKNRMGMLDQKHFISVEEHQAIISDLESRLKIATEALEKIHKYLPSDFVLTTDDWNMVKQALKIKGEMK